MLERILSLTVCMLSVCMFASAQQRMQRYDDAAPVFAGQGTWMVGGTASYTAHRNSNYSFAVIDGINSVGFHLSAEPEASYYFKDNIGVGIRAGYGRMMLDAASGGAEIGQLELSVTDYYQISHDFSTTIFMRYFIPIAGSQRIALFVDGGLQGVYGQLKVSECHTGNEVGTWQEKWKAGLVVNPGVMAYVNGRLALSASLGMAGLTWGNVAQIHNQVAEGALKSFRFSYLLDFTSLNVGLNVSIGKK